ncbi:MAG TPA: 4Fe-4S ferredoxin [Thermoplasmata archaeon]|nr:4Fe-4S ferredoxin [Thermoplasmata archaeon]
MTISSELVLSVLAAGMVLTTAGLVKWASTARTALRAATVLFLLMMMAGMLIGAAIYFLHPGATGLVEGFWVASALMSVSVLAVFVAFLQEARAQAAEGERYSSPGLRHTAGFVASVIALVFVNELLMGWTFSAAAGSAIGSSGSGLAGTFGLLIAVVNSPWFLFTMSGEMIVTAVLLRDQLPRPLFITALFQAGIMFLSPPALTAGWWTSLAIYGSSVLMIVLFVYAMEFLYRHRELPGGFATYLVALLGIYGLMMAGIFVWQYYGDASLFALSVAAEMVLFYEAVVRPERLAARPGLTWQLNARWAFSVLAAIFVAELFMGAVLDLALEPSLYVGAFGALPVAGGVATATGNALQNGFWFIATVTGSTWFLAMMGAEMGALVVFKYRETKSRETRIRLGLMLGCYGAFAVFYPSLYYGLAFPNAPSGTTVPVLGWSMGIGSAPLAVGVFGVLLITYAVTGILTFLFGRRVVCSVFCTAPLMYQGTTIDAMKSFNAHSPIGRRYLSSRLSNAYTATTGAVMGSLAIASVISYLNTTGRTSWYLPGSVDPTVFLFSLYFGVLWYVMFVTIPYTGNYNCVTMGWCYTGTFAQAFQKLGPFKLKVHSKDVCRACTTVDCAKGCPIGLTDMPGHFRRTGEFRSTKCCGVGNCVEACPYGNLYIYDIRHWIRERLGLPIRPSPSPMLPMARPSAPSRPAAAASTASVGPATAASARSRL